MKIAIEGMDGAGKTTLAKKLAEKLDYTYIDKPFKFLFNDLNIGEDDLKKIEWKLYETEDEVLMTLFYGLGIAYGTRCNQLENIIYDRHFVSNYYWHGTAETFLLHNEIIHLCGEPDLTILLKASVQTRMKRIYERDNQDNDLSNVSMYDEGYEKMENFLRNNEFNYIIIDTENLSPNEVFLIAIQAIKKERTLTKERKKKLHE